VAQQYDTPPEMVIDTATTYTASIRTNKGTITAKLFADEAPNTVNNFVFLAREGFYDGVIFHRIIEGFMMQGGDPNTRDDENPGTWGMGGPGHRIPDEFHHLLLCSPQAGDTPHLLGVGGLVLLPLPLPTRAPLMAWLPESML
jgi:hypothetical protein